MPLNIKCSFDGVHPTQMRCNCDVVWCCAGSNTSVGEVTLVQLALWDDALTSGGRAEARLEMARSFHRSSNNLL